RPEAEIFADVAAAAGVPRERILVEARSTNTAENVAFSRELLAGRGLHPRRAIAVQKPYMERRTHATFRRGWPEPGRAVPPPPLPAGLAGAGRGRPPAADRVRRVPERGDQPGRRHPHHGRRPAAADRLRREGVVGPPGGPAGSDGGVRRPRGGRLHREAARRIALSVPPDDLQPAAAVPLGLRAPHAVDAEQLRRP